MFCTTFINVSRETFIKNALQSENEGILITGKVIHVSLKYHTEFVAISTKELLRVVKKKQYFRYIL